VAIIEPVGTMGPRGVRPQRARPKVTLPKPDRIPAMRENFRNRGRDREGYTTLEIPPNYEMPKPQIVPDTLGKTYERMPVAGAKSPAVADGIAELVAQNKAKNALSDHMRQNPWAYGEGNYRTGSTPGLDAAIDFGVAQRAASSPMQDRGRVQRELDLMALTDGLKNQRDLDAQFLGIDMTPKQQVVNQSGDNQLPVNTGSALGGNMGELAGQIAPGNQNNMGGGRSANYGSPSYGGYLAPELIALKAKLAASERQRQKALRDRAIYLDDSRRAFAEADKTIDPAYQRRGLGPDTGLITRDRRKLGENQIRSEGRYDLSYGDLMEDIAIRDDAARRQAFANAMRRYQADVAARAAMKPNILEAF